MFEKVLVCLDGSELAEQILPLAEAQARQFESHVVLLRIVPLLVSEIVEAGATYNDPKIAAENEQLDFEQSTSYLENVSFKFKAKNISVETVIIKAAPVGKAILDYAEEQGVNLIAIATHGRGGLRRLVFGSVADHVLRESGLPMLVIRPKNT